MKKSLSAFLEGDSTFKGVPNFLIGYVKAVAW